MSETEVHDAKGAVISRSDGRDDGEEWTENHEELPGGAGISIILESTNERRSGPAPPSAPLRRDLPHPARLRDIHNRH
jgi:hypothetical protein